MWPDVLEGLKVESGYQRSGGGDNRRYLRVCGQLPWLDGFAAAWAAQVGQNTFTARCTGSPGPARPWFSAWGDACNTARRWVRRSPRWPGAHRCNFPTMVVMATRHRMLLQHASGNLYPQIGRSPGMCWHQPHCLWVPNRSSNPDSGWITGSLPVRCHCAVRPVCQSPRGTRQFEYHS